MRLAPSRAAEFALRIAERTKEIFARPKPQRGIAPPATSSECGPGGSLRPRKSVDQPWRTAISLSALAVRRPASCIPPTPSSSGKRPTILLGGELDSGPIIFGKQRRRGSRNKQDKSSQPLAPSMLTAEPSGAASSNRCDGLWWTAAPSAAKDWHSGSPGFLCLPLAFVQRGRRVYQ